MELRRGVRPSGARAPRRGNDDATVLGVQFDVAGETSVLKERLRDANAL